jgi:predicted anti-sigma-YlaC factor YlaD
MLFVRALAILPEACNRTRQHVSLRLDKQLSELEVAVMENHLARCPACRSFADELEGVTEALRDADLVEPPIHFEVPHRPARVGMTRAGAATAAAVLVAVALGAVAGLGPNAPVSDRYVADLQGAQEAGSLEEHFALVSDGATVARSVMPHGVAAAERTTVGPPTEGW